jgi:hypothetical protein
MKHYIFLLFLFLGSGLTYAQGAFFSVFSLSADLLRAESELSAGEKDEFTSYSFYESGELKAIKPIVNGKFEGELLSYYPDGELRRREFFDNGRSIGGICFDMDGKILPYEPFMEFAKLKNGQDAAEIMDQHASFIFRTKKSAQIKELKVVLNINQFGKLVGYKFLTDADNGTKERVAYVLRQMQDWHPAVEEGVYVPMDFELTIRN